MLPKVSIITTTKNAEKHIPQFMQFVAGVFYPNLELIILDAVSTDRTLQLIQDYKQNLDVIVVSEPDDGIYFAMNKGIDIATGDFILHLGADDRLTNPFVFSTIFQDASMASCDIIYGKFRYVHNPYRTAGKFKTYKDLLVTSICHQSVLFKRDLFARLGKYNTRFPVCADQVFLLQCFRSHLLNIRFVDIVIASYALGGFSSTTPDSEFAFYRKRTILKTFGRKTWLKFLIKQRIDMVAKFLKI